MCFFIYDFKFYFLIGSEKINVMYRKKLIIKVDFIVLFLKDIIFNNKRFVEKKVIISWVRIKVCLYFLYVFLILSMFNITKVIFCIFLVFNIFLGIRKNVIML